MTVKVKICSITNTRDALAALELGADFLGFIGVPDTPRFVTAAEYRQIAAELPAAARTVIVTRTVEEGVKYGTPWIQYYSGDPAAAPVGVNLMPVIRPRSEAELEQDMASVSPRASALVVDAYHDRSLGGASVTGDWNLAARAVDVARRPVFLAGGLTPQNVAEAIARVKPWAVDVSSGVESMPRIKDHDRLRAFIAAAKAASGPY